MKTQIRDILASKGSHYEAVEPSLTVDECIMKMNNEKIGSLLIVQDNQLLGIFTERDIMVKVYGEHIETASTTVDKVMTKGVICAKLTTTVEEAMFTITEKRFRHLPVVDDGGKLVGLVSSGDITKWLVSDKQEEIDTLNDYIAGEYH